MLSLSGITCSFSRCNNPSQPQTYFDKSGMWQLLFPTKHTHVDIHPNVVKWILEEMSSKLNKKKEKWWGPTLLVSVLLSPLFRGSRHQPCLDLADGVWLRPDLMNACLQGMTLTFWSTSLQESRIVLKKKKESPACFIHSLISCHLKYEAAECYEVWCLFFLLVKQTFSFSSRRKGQHVWLLNLSISNYPLNLR